MATLGVAVHGAGWVSGEHIKAYTKNPNTEVRVVSSRKAESARARAEENGIRADISTDFGKVLARDDIDVVSICTPNHLHPSETIAAAQAGKHILIEKPAAMNLDDLRAMRDAVRRAGVKTVVSFVLHWNPYFQTVKALLDDGALGKVFYVATDYLHEIGPWWTGYEWARRKETGGSAMLTGGCHAVDAIRWFCGEVEEVSAYATRGHRQDYEYEPTIVAALKFKNGAIGKVGTSFEIEMPYVFNVELHGSEGAIRNEKLYSKRKFPGLTGFMTIPTIMPDSGDVTHHPFQGEIDHFVECIMNNQESPVNLEDAVKTHEVCIAIDQSAAQGGRPVRLPLLRDG
jgi:predicted dehydrogenase